MGHAPRFAWRWRGKTSPERRRHGSPGQRPGITNCFSHSKQALKGRNNPVTMSQSLAKNLVHLIYSTRNRQACLKARVRPPLWAYMAGILQQWESSAIVIGGIADHVHILFALSKNHALKKLVEEVKKGSSKWLKTQALSFRTFIGKTVTARSQSANRMSRRCATILKRRRTIIACALSRRNFVNF